MNLVLLILSLVLWSVVHTILASLAAKDFIHRLFGPRLMRLYRLGYNLFSALSFLPIAWLALVLPDHPLYSIPAPWSLLMRLGQASAALLLMIGLLQTDTLSFIGLRQLLEESGAARLVTNGLYRYVRHPLYAAGLLILWLSPALSLNSFVVYANLTAYIVIGAHFEERKLLREFGSAYAEYQRATPMLIPGLVIRH